MLVYDPAKRISAKAALEHSWFTQNFPQTKNFSSKIVSNFSNFHS